MKKLLIFLLALALFAVGCSDTKNESAPPLEGVSAQTEIAEELPFDLGVTITVENLTPTGATLRIEHSGGKVTGELMTGSAFSLEKLDGNIWLPVEPIVPADQIAFTAEAYGPALDGTWELETNWEYLYGELPAGTYRLGKNIMDFRGTGDYDEQVYFAEFTL